MDNTNMENENNINNGTNNQSLNQEVSQFNTPTAGISFDMPEIHNQTQEPTSFVNQQPSMPTYTTPTQDVTTSYGPIETPGVNQTENPFPQNVSVNEQSQVVPNATMETPSYETVSTATYSTPVQEQAPVYQQSVSMENINNNFSNMQEQNMNQPYVQGAMQPEMQPTYTQPVQQPVSNFDVPAYDPNISQTSNMEGVGNQGFSSPLAPAGNESPVAVDPNQMVPNQDSMPMSQSMPQGNSTNETSGKKNGMGFIIGLGILLLIVIIALPYIAKLLK